jgi:UDP-2,3-diacylglucosamine pyrophosphatase LpxH
MKKHTIIISDLHIGGGAKDPGDDHVYQGRELERFVVSLGKTDEGGVGDIELYINGDFLEFAQTLQGAYKGRDSKAWCSESESLLKLRAILSGHANIFAALGEFMTLGNQVTVGAGNHDVDLYWESVRKELTQAVHPDLAFEIGTEWVERYDRKLQIAHGHLPDPANTFKMWDKPFVSGASEPRLEMCAGTLFMVKFVNFLEKEYPFADNIYPVQRLANLLAKNDKKGLAVVAWAFLRFAAANPGTMSADSAEASGTFGQGLLAKIQQDETVAVELASVADDGRGITVHDLRRRLRTEQALAEFLLAHWPELSSLPVWDQVSTSHALSADGSSNSLGTIYSSSSFGKESLRVSATNRASKVPETQVVVMGHTHIPDECYATHKVKYFNPGSWTRYADVSQIDSLVLDDLRDESKFPYALNYVQIERPGADGQIAASKNTFESSAGSLKSN